MFRYICKTLFNPRNGYITVAPHKPVSLSLIRCFSSDSADNPHSFTVSYLTKTCGLSPKSALSASKSFQFKSPDKPDLVLSCFQKFGFSKTQISEMIRKFPKMLHCDPGKTTSPKVEFFRSIGASTPDLVKIFTVNPWILNTSLENKLVPTCNILIEVFESKGKAIEAIKRNPWLLRISAEAILQPNVNTLRQNGMPRSNISQLIYNHRICIATNPVKFRKIVEEVKEMGFNPLKFQCIDAIVVLTAVNKSKWDGRVEVYKRWGCSDKDINNAFKKFPLCMSISEDNIMGTLDFYVNKLGLESSVILNRPKLLGYSLKKRLIPRGAVIQYLLSKGLVKSDSRITNMFECTVKCLLEKFENCFTEEAPHLIKMYNDKLHDTTTSEGNVKMLVNNRSMIVSAI